MSRQQRITQPGENQDLVSKLAGKFRGALLRIGFHFLCLLFAVLISSAVRPETFLSNPEGDSGPIGIVVYLGLILIFPRKPQPINSSVSLITGLLWCLFGPWQLAFAWAALQRLLLDIINKRDVLTFSRLGSLCLLIILFLAFTDLHPWAYISKLFLLLFVVLTGVGVLVKRWLLVRAKMSVAAASIEAVDPQPILSIYTDQIDGIYRLNRRLPDYLKPHIDNICQQGRLILTSMEHDPRDIPAGEKFLNRYLSAVEKIVVQNVKINSVAVKSAQMDAALKDSEQLLERISSAFTEQQLKLLENDTQDLTVELNLLDKLLKMEGFK